ncbi:MAG TPA: glutamine synthetase family protein [Candidatus Binatia bacterium]|jgi:glutamine synthetase|nr:glutamine synthetase family protein [Candidatus Binatia bacterium]
MKLPELKARIAAKDIDTIVVAFPDVFGRPLGKRLTAHHFLDAVARHGTHACSYLLTVNMEMDPLAGFPFANWEKGYGDFELKLDLDTLRPLPWQTATALVVCDLFQPGGKRVEEAPRSVLRRQLERLAKAGLTCQTASELEFFLFNQTCHSAFIGRYTSLAPASDYRIDCHTLQPAREESLMRALRNFMDAAGVPIESSKGEWGKGQHEVNFVYAQPLPMADGHTLFKQAAKEIADQQGKCVTFMAKPDAAEVGSSCHIHLSLWQKAKNVFWDARTRRGSKYFRQFLGGLLKYSPELCYFFAPTINAYKRFQPASWAPTKMAWAFDNRTVGYRVVGQGNSFRLENRMPGADANPYLAFAAMLAAGLAGIEENLDCGEVYPGNAYADPSLPALPRSLRDAAALLESSKMARRAFTAPVTDFYVHTARCEVQAFNDAVTDWEKVRYFERI